MTSRKKDKPSIGISGVASMLLTTIMILIPDIPNTPEQLWWISCISLLILYFFLGLINGEYSEIGELVVQVLFINKNSISDAKEKIILIREQLDIYSGFFMDIFTEVREQMGGKHKFHKHWEDIKSVTNRAIKGRLTPLQWIWILCYLVYRLLIENNYYNLDTPVDMVISIFFIGGLQLTSYNIGGIGKLLKDIFKNANRKEADSAIILNEIIHTIRILCLGYNKIAKHIEEMTNMPIMDFITQSTQPIQ